MFKNNIFQFYNAVLNPFCSLQKIYLDLSMLPAMKYDLLFNRYCKGVPC